MSTTKTSLEQELMIEALLSLDRSAGVRRGSFRDGVTCGLLIAVGLLDLDIADQSAEEAMHHGQEILAASMDRRRRNRR